MASQPSIMLAAVVDRFNAPYAFREIPRPAAPSGYDMLVKVLAASYCHTDAVFASGGMSQDLPRVGCHEFAGQVVSVGERVVNLTIGSRVGVPGRAYHPCGECVECQNPHGDQKGYSPYCPRAGNLGLTRDGGFQQYCLVDSRQVAPLPETLEATQAAPLMCAGLTVWAALLHEKVRDARRIVILGAGGGLGHLGVQFAALMGKEVVAADASDTALDLLTRIKVRLGLVGENIAIHDARKADVDSMKGWGQGVNNAAPAGEVGMDAAILLPDSQQAFDLGMKLLRNHGTMVVVSFPKDKLEVSAHDVVFRDISVVGSLVGRNHQLREMLDFVGKHGVRVEVKTLPFRQLNDLVSLSKQGASGKLVIDMEH